MIVVIMLMKIGYSVTQYLAHRHNFDVMIINAFRIFGFAMVTVIVHPVKMSLLMFVDLEIGHVLIPCLNAIRVAALIKILFVMVVS